MTTIDSVNYEITDLDRRGFAVPKDDRGALFGVKITHPTDGRHLFSIVPCPDGPKGYHVRRMPTGDMVSRWSNLESAKYHALALAIDDSARGF